MGKKWAWGKEVEQDAQSEFGPASPTDGRLVKHEV